MAKFIRVTNIAQGIDMDTILNVDDIGHISIGPNIIFVKTPFADGTNRIYVRTETIEQLEKILLEGENNGKTRSSKSRRRSADNIKDIWWFCTLRHRPI